MLAGRCAKERGFDEALLVTPHGRVLEAPTSSLFWVRRATACSRTPPLDDHILASITRAYVIEVTEVPRSASAPQDDLRQASEAFLASTTREVQPVGAIEDIELDAPGSARSEAAKALRARIEEALGSRASATSRASGGSRTTRGAEPRRPRR